MLTAKERLTEVFRVPRGLRINTIQIWKNMKVFCKFILSWMPTFCRQQKHVEYVFAKNVNISEHTPPSSVKLPDKTTSLKLRYLVFFLTYFVSYKVAGTSSILWPNGIANERKGIRTRGRHNILRKGAAEGWKLRSHSFNGLQPYMTLQTNYHAPSGRKHPRVLPDP